MHKPIAVANKILSIARATDDPAVTPMQLIKLTYLAHGWMLGMYGRPLISESVQAWRYGPVIRSLYDNVSRFKDKPVPYPIKTLFGGSAANEVFDEAESSVIQQTHNLYGSWDGIALSRLTHMPGSPWHETWHSEGQNGIISDDIIEHHYRDKFRELTAAKVTP